MQGLREAALQAAEGIRPGDVEPDLEDEPLQIRGPINGELKRLLLKVSKATGVAPIHVLKMEALEGLTRKYRDV